MSAPPPLRIAILECDIPIGNTREKYGGYGNLFKELLLKGADEVRRDGKEGGALQVPELDVSKYNVVDDELYPNLEDTDVVLISGSRKFLTFVSFFFLEGLFWRVVFHALGVDLRRSGRMLSYHFMLLIADLSDAGFNSFDDDIWILKLVDFAKKVLFEQTRVRLIGVCFGHQIIGRALGQKVGRSEGGWEISVSPVQLTDKGKELFGVKELVSEVVSLHRVFLYCWSYLHLPHKHAYTLPHRPFTKCTKTPSSPTRPRSSTWVTLRAAMCRVCMERNAS
jgi:hypothetical protein